MKLTFSAASKELREYGMTIKVKNGEYRVNFKNGTWKTAYYSTDLLDALETGIIMSKEQNAGKPK